MSQDKILKIKCSLWDQQMSIINLDEVYQD